MVQTIHKYDIFECWAGQVKGMNCRCPGGELTQGNVSEVLSSPVAHLTSSLEYFSQSHLLTLPFKEKPPKPVSSNVALTFMFPETLMFHNLHFH